MKKRYEDGVVPQSSRDVRMDMAKQMREARLGMNLTQQVVAERAGTRSLISPVWRVGNTIPHWIFW